MIFVSKRLGWKHTISHVIGLFGPIGVKQKEILRMDARLIGWPQNLTLPMTLTWDFQGHFFKVVSQELCGGGGGGGMEQKGCEPIGCWTHYVNLTLDFQSLK